MILWFNNISPGSVVSNDQASELWPVGLLMYGSAWVHVLAFGKAAAAAAAAELICRRAR
jgi:hypothetical protein